MQYLEMPAQSGLMDCFRLMSDLQQMIKQWPNAHRVFWFIDCVIRGPETEKHPLSFTSSLQIQSYAVIM